MLATFGRSRAGFGLMSQGGSHASYFRSHRRVHPSAGGYLRRPRRARVPRPRASNPPADGRRARFPARARRAARLVARGSAQGQARHPGSGSRGARAGRHSEEAARAGFHHAAAPRARARRVGAPSSSARAMRTGSPTDSSVRPGRDPGAQRAALLLRLQAALHAHARFLRSHVRRVRRLQLRQALADGGSARTRGVDQRRSRQDRVSSRDHAAPCRGARDRDDALSARCGAPLRAGE